MKKFTNCLTLFFFLLISKAAFPFVVQIATTPDICNYHNGTMTANAFGGSGFYSYSWSNGAIGATVTGLSAGITLTVMASDGSTTATASATIVSQSYLNPAFFTYAGSFPCEGMCNGRLFAPTDQLGGISPYSGTFDGIAMQMSNLPFPNCIGLPNVCWNQQPYVFITDAQGCSVSYSENPVYFVPAPVISNVVVTNATNGNNGSAYVESNALNNYIPNYYSYIYFYANGTIIPNATTSQITSLCAGNYSVQITSRTGHYTGTGTSGLWIPESCSSATAQFTIGGCGIPTNFTTTNLHPNSAKLNWAINDCAVGYNVQYKTAGGGAWINKSVNSNIGFKKINGLSANTHYAWRVRSKCAANPNLFSNWSATTSFYTPLREGEVEVKQPLGLTVFPNPASGYVTLKVPGAGDATSILIQNTLGQTIDASAVQNGAGVWQVDVSGLSDGIYMVTVVAGGEKLTKFFVKE